MSEETVVEQQVEQTQVDSNASFEKGFNSERGLPPPEEKPVEAAPAKEPVVEEPAAEVQPDEWEGVSPKVKAELESMRGQLAKVPDRLRNIEGHIGGLTSQLKTALSAKAAVEKDGAAAPTQTQIAQAKTSEKWAALKEDYPDWAEAMDERLAALPAQAPVDVEALKAGIRAEIAAETGKTIKGVEERAVELAVLKIKHPGWVKTINTPEFEAWFAPGGPPAEERHRIKAIEETDPAKASAMWGEVAKRFPKWWDAKGKLATSPLADDALVLLDAYTAAEKTAKKAADAQKDKTQRLAAATTPQGVGAQPLPTKDDADALNAGFERVRRGG